MRRYLQGTLDFDCAIYAVINALSCTHRIDLMSARNIFQETILSLSGSPRLWRAFVRNETDYYWMIRHLLSRWCGKGPHHLQVGQPFGDCLLPNEFNRTVANLESIPLYLPENPAFADSRAEATAVWESLSAWFVPPGSCSSDTPCFVNLPAVASVPQGIRPRAAILRFHRFMPGIAMPVVSHWTTAVRILDEVLFLHDASGEKNSLQCLNKADLLSSEASPLVRIVPESLLLVQK